MKLSGKRILERGKNTIAAGAGGVGVALLNNVIPTSINPKLKAAGLLLLCAALPEFSPKTKVLEHAADGGAGVAAVIAANALGMGSLSIAGIGEVGAHMIDEDFIDSPLNGFDDPTVNGNEDSVH